jgi:hypothetical protein
MLRLGGEPEELRINPVVRGSRTGTLTGGAQCRSGARRRSFPDWLEMVTVFISMPRSLWNCSYEYSRCCGRMIGWGLKELAMTSGSSHTGPRGLERNVGNLDAISDTARFCPSRNLIPNLRASIFPFSHGPAGARRNSGASMSAICRSRH